MKYNLQPVYSRQKSFYNKAVVEETNNKNTSEKRLYSYGTLVARIIKRGGLVTYHHLGVFSNTTTKHQIEFFKQSELNDNTDYLKLKANGILTKKVD